MFKKSLFVVIVLASITMAQKNKLIEIPRNNVDEEVREAMTEIIETIQDIQIDGTTLEDHSAKTWETTKEKSKELGTKAVDKTKEGIDSLLQRMRNKEIHTGNPNVI
jgi:transcriptional regulator of heat shock response